MITALALLLSLSGPAQAGVPVCPHVRIAEPATPALAGGRCRVVLYEPDRAPGPRAPEPAPPPEPERPCRVEIVPHAGASEGDCTRVRLHEARHGRGSHRVRAGDAITLDAVSLATLEGGVGGGTAPILIAHGGGTVIVQSSATATASASAQASAHASVRIRSGHGGHHGGH
ncbi:hypothetical protein E5163_08610 [Marinicauda algicola]|uniref:Uncharacterized protein n=1 Tax=Marinicauda algicola TaxID=2029849 RepID=A0A4S2H183_9PROT|nr:hypothetical protein [Marinicauda algicola]TGY89173.1 hypothetical protein E5163_08610 [Marinicauda algicola]